MLKSGWRWIRTTDCRINEQGPYHSAIPTSLATSDYIQYSKVWKQIPPTPAPETQFNTVHYHRHHAAFVIHWSASMTHVRVVLNACQPFSDIIGCDIFDHLFWFRVVKRKNSQAETNEGREKTLIKDNTIWHDTLVASIQVSKSC